MAEEKASEAQSDKAAAEGAQEGESGGEGAQEGESVTREEKRTASLNSQFAALKRHQREWGQTYNAQRAEMEKERKALTDQIELLKRARAEAHTNPEEWLRQGGIDRNTVAKFYEGRQGQAPYDHRFDSLAAEVQGLRQALAERDRRAEQYEAQAAQMQRDRNLDSVSREVKAGGDAFELINHYDAYQDVADCQALYFERTGERMTVQEAAERVEGVLATQREEDIKKALASPKLAKRLGWEPKNPEPDEAKAEAEQKPKQPPPRRGKTPKPRPDDTDAKLSPDERWAKIMLQRTGRGPQL